MSAADQVILAKIRARYGQRLRTQDYAELLHRRSVGEIAAYLKNETHYRGILAGVQEMTIHRGQLEELLHHDLLDSYLRLMKYNKSGNSFYRYYLTGLEVEQIISCIAHLNAGRPEQYMDELPGYLIARLSIDLRRMAQAADLPGLLRALEGTPYHRVLLPVIGDGHAEMPRCEHALRSYYYQTVLASIDRHYHGREREEIRRFFLIQAEVFNVTVIYRLKRFFGEDEETIRTYLLPYGSQLRRARLEEMIAAKDADAFLTLLAASRFGRYFDTGSRDFFIEHDVETLNYRSSSRILHFTTSPAAAFAAYLVLMQLEIANIVNIVEGVRYGVSPEEIERLLVLS